MAPPRSKFQNLLRSQKRKRAEATASAPTKRRGLPTAGISTYRDEHNVNENQPQPTAEATTVTLPSTEKFSATDEPSLSKPSKAVAKQPPKPKDDLSHSTWNSNNSAEGWECGACTMLNPIRLRRCAVCSGRRAVNVAATSSSTASSIAPRVENSSLFSTSGQSTEPKNGEEPTKGVGVQQSGSVSKSAHRTSIAPESARNPALMPKRSVSRSKTHADVELLLDGEDQPTAAENQPEESSSSLRANTTTPKNGQPELEQVALSESQKKKRASKESSSKRKIEANTSSADSTLTSDAPMSHQPPSAQDDTKVQNLLAENQALRSLLDNVASKMGRAFDLLHSQQGLTIELQKQNHLILERQEIAATEQKTMLESSRAVQNNLESLKHHVETVDGELKRTVNQLTGVEQRQKDAEKHQKQSQEMAKTLHGQVQEVQLNMELLQPRLQVAENQQAAILKKNETAERQQGEILQQTKGLDNSFQAVHNEIKDLKSTLRRVENKQGTILKNGNKVVEDQTAVLGRTEGIGENMRKLQSSVSAFQDAFEPTKERQTQILHKLDDLGVQRAAFVGETDLQAGLQRVESKIDALHALADESSQQLSPPIPDMDKMELNSTTNIPESELHKEGNMKAALRPVSAAKGDLPTPFVPDASSAAPKGLDVVKLPMMPTHARPARVSVLPVNTAPGHSDLQRFEHPDIQEAPNSQSQKKSPSPAKSTQTVDPGFTADSCAKKGIDFALDQSPFCYSARDPISPPAATNHGQGKHATEPVAQSRYENLSQGVNHHGPAPPLPPGTMRKLDSGLTPGSKRRDRSLVSTSVRKTLPQGQLGYTSSFHARSWSTPGDKNDSSQEEIMLGTPEGQDETQDPVDQGIPPSPAGSTQTLDPDLESRFTRNSIGADSSSFYQRPPQSKATNAGSLAKMASASSPKDAAPAGQTSPTTPTLRNRSKRNMSPPPNKGWISNQSSRAFMREVDSAAQRQQPDLPEQNQWIQARKQPRATGTSAKGADTNGDGLWDESQQPNYPYKETVRCKAERQGMRCHDCEQCRKWYFMLQSTGHNLSQDPLQNSRHRSRFATSETPQDFWELDFIDELRDEERKKEA